MASFIKWLGDTWNTVNGWLDGKIKNTAVKVTTSNAGKAISNQANNELEAVGIKPSTVTENATETAEPKQELPKTGIENNIPIINQESQEGSFNVQQWIDNVEEWRNEQWAREDAIRKETQAREDSAYSRAIADLRRSGANINLLGNINPAESGGGITNSTGIDTSLIGNAMDGNIEAFIQENQAVIDKALMELEQAFEKGQNNTDRVIEIIGDLLRLGGMVSSAMLFRK